LGENCTGYGGLPGLLPPDFGFATGGVTWAFSPTLLRYTPIPVGFDLFQHTPYNLPKLTLLRKEPEWAIMREHSLNTTLIWDDSVVTPKIFQGMRKGGFRMFTG
jgi:hypothetical protein